MSNNSLDTLAGATELAEIFRAVESAKSLKDLSALTERLHAVGHTLLDALAQA